MDVFAYLGTGAKGHHSHVIKIRYRQADRLGLYVFYYSKAEGGLRFLSGVTFYSLAGFGVVWIYIVTDPHRT